MSNAPILRLRRFTALCALLAGICCAQLALAQGGWTASTRMMPLAAADAMSPASPEAMDQTANPPRRGPLARLIENPDQTDGAPPYALTDQTGTVQRYVEPVPGIDLASHVGRIVVVRNDTGPTLLATQLDLPQQPARPMAMPAPNGPMPGALPFRAPLRQIIPESRVVPAQFIDNDDSSVQLLPEDGSAPGVPMGGPSGELPLLSDGYPGYPAYPGYPGQMMPGPMPGEPYGAGGYEQYYEPMQYGPGMMPAYPAPVVSPQPVAAAGPQPLQGPHISGDVEFLFYRVHMTDQVFGKLSENYEFSPRVTLDFRNIGYIDGRVRYWHYARDTNVNTGGDVRLEWNVLDIEAMHYFEGRRSQLSLSAGIRLADVQIDDATGEGCGSDMMGLTMAADGLTPVICMTGGYCGWVYGGRVSLLGGDWGGDDNTILLNGQFRDDNILVTELYAGAEIARRCRNATVRGRLIFDMQNWRSDALAQFAGIESIAFLGPAAQLGIDF
jgi:hypothetical protein